MFKSFMVTNHVPQPKKSNLEVTKPKPTCSDFADKNNVVAKEDWFTLKKFEVRNPDFEEKKVPRNVQKLMEQFNKDNFV